MADTRRNTAELERIGIAPKTNPRRPYHSLAVADPKRLLSVDANYIFAQRTLTDGLSAIVMGLAKKHPTRFSDPK